MDLKTSLQTDYIGSKYNLLEFYLYKDVSGADFYVDAVHIGKRATTNDENGLQLDTSFGFGWLLFNIKASCWGCAKKKKKITDFLQNANIFLCIKFDIDV